jgi:hypothetical protein
VSKELEEAREKAWVKLCGGGSVIPIRTKDEAKWFSKGFDTGFQAAQQHTAEVERKLAAVLKIANEVFDSAEASIQEIGCDEHTQEVEMECPHCLAHRKIRTGREALSKIAEPDSAVALTPASGEGE